ncbi:MAG: class I SAM-dependent methyltransferase [Methanosarcinales archaeon]|nr:class I SAM-dependent methyltransferase [Methanosarcinales archaeon]
MDRIKRAKMRRRFFRNLAPAYDASARMVLFGYYYHMRRQVREKIDIKEGMRILDIASGTGYVAEILKPADVVCTDITVEMLNRARHKTDAMFVLAEMFRTLKPGGDIVVMDVVQQKSLLKKIKFQVFHTWVDQRAAHYMKLEDLEKGFDQADNFNL